MYHPVICEKYQRYQIPRHFEVVTVYHAAC